MELQPELTYCDVINSEEEYVQPLRPPLPKRPENISASFIEVHNSPERIPASRSMTVTMNTCQVVLSIAVIIFAILSAVFMTLYFTTEVKFRSCDGKNSLPNSRPDNICQNYSIVSNCSGSKTSNNTDFKTLKMKYEKLANTSNCNDTSQCSKFSILFPRRSNKSYVFPNNDIETQGMTAITACFWVNTTQTEGTATYVSYATSSDTNEFFVYAQNNIRIAIRNSGSPPKSKSATNDGKWHSICCSWSSQKGEYKIYKDGKSVNSGEDFQKDKTIRGGGTWVLGQDQDGSPGGGFQLKDAMQGEISEMNIWDKELSYEEIQEFSKPHCQRHDQLGAGNLVKSWDDFVAGRKRDVKIVQRPKCCNV